MDPILIAGTLHLGRGFTSQATGGPNKYIRPDENDLLQCKRD